MSDRENTLNFAKRVVIGLTATVALTPSIVAGFRAGPLLVQFDAPTRAKEAALKDALFTMRKAIDQYYIDKKGYPKDLNSLVIERYIQKIPTDPLTNRTDSWRTIRSKPVPKQTGRSAGIYDVKSGSRGTAMDGTKYSDW